MASAATGLAAWRGRHQDQTVVVCGCGRSLRDLPTPAQWLTIGVNDVGRLFDPTYLVVVNPRTQFSGDRFEYVARSRARALFTQLDQRALPVPHPAIVRFRLGRRGGTDLSAADALPYTRNSPYIAVCLAAFLGARRIGLIGVDFTDHHFFRDTGRHPLAREFEAIDREYAALAAALQARGVELVNLSRDSRLTALPKAEPVTFLGGGAALPVAAPTPAAKPPRVFFVHYQFLSCGDVFATGLENAARDLGIEWASASCDDPRLPDKVHGFDPDVLFVVHGRKFRQRWGSRVRARHRAVWLLDEPYEVDDTAQTSRLFHTVFVNDPSTVDRHAQAHYLPVAWDPHVHVAPDTEARKYNVGFIGGGNPTREQMLLCLVREGLLSYVVGGPWTSRELRSLCLSANIPASQTAALYRETRIVVNVFRDKHHFNRRNVAAHSMNPRIYEALACGALVVSEHRPEIAQVFPELPTFSNAEGLATHVRALLGDLGALRSLRDASRARLSAHTYAERLRAVLEAVRSENEPATRCGVESMTAERRVPETSILMVVHGGLDMTRLAVLRTLRHSTSADARLVVVDNASSDGTREWLRLMAERGDLDLIEAASNIGHGPGLELARGRTRSPYLVTLDSDAFPLADDWIAQLRRRLDAGAAVAGILHHRNYIHPACLMVARRTLDEHGLTFLNEKDRPSHLDVAERISVDMLRQGRSIAGLTRTAARRRGSKSEPVFLGSEYEGIVYHQWYSTRANEAPGRPVDDVPRQALDQSLVELLDEDWREPRDVTVVVGVRADADVIRKRNAHAVLRALNDQDLPRYRYRIVLVEQSAEPVLRREFAPLVDRYIHAANAGPYNRGWAFNIGAAVTPDAALCFVDADLLVPPDFLRRGVDAIAGGAAAVLPYRAVRYLTAAESQRAIAERLQSPGARPDPERFSGRRFTDSEGGTLLVRASTYRDIGGHDERFRGWGCEDREICQRLARAGAGPARLDGCLLHLDHPRPAESDGLARANQELLVQLTCSQPARTVHGAGDLRRYADLMGDGLPGASGQRAWEQWHTWDAQRIQRIIADERATPAEESSRRALADLAARAGARILDVGCGPGALWLHWERHAPHVRWAGTDVTRRMLAVAREHFAAVPVVQADAAQLPWATDAFDVVVLRHVLEHLPPELMPHVVTEATRVARRAVMVAFHTPPIGAERTTTAVGGGFLQTRWACVDVEDPVTAAGWKVRERALLGGRDADHVWVLTPADCADEVVLTAAPLPLRSTESLKFSIVMPTYKRRHRLEATVATIVAQTYRNWELIIVDNAGDCEARFADPRISVYVHAEKASAAYARNQGLRYVTGDLVCHFDDDDDMFPTYLERLAAMFRRHPRAKMVRCGMIVTGGRVNYSHATPEVCLRREYATPTWKDDGPAQDQHYYSRIVARQRWTVKGHDIVTLRTPLCRANSDPRGGLREGRF